MKVTGNLTITAENAHEYSELESVDGSLDVRAPFTAPALTNVGERLDVHAPFIAPALTKVGGWLNVHAPFDAPALTNVSGSLYVNAPFTAPALTNIDGWLDVRAPFTAPALTNIDGWLYVYAPLTAPALTKVGGEEITKFSYLLGLRYSVLCTDNYVRIGCKRHTRDEWAAFTDVEINAMDTDALSFWREYKDAILNKNT